MAWVKDEKAALVATLRSTDSHADTLCDGWDVRRLLAHLVIREQDLVASVRDAVARKPPGQEPNLGRLSTAAATPDGYAALVDRFVSGPPRWSPMSWAGEQINLVEYVIHHEDVRRAGSAPAAPRTLAADQQQAVWKQLGLFARLGLRKAPVGVVLAQPGGPSRLAKVGDGVTLTGEPVELALYVSGRRASARVEVTGPAEAVAQFEAWTAAG